MKKQFIICFLASAMILSLSGIVFASQPAAVKNFEKMKKLKPIPQSKIKMVKKIVLPIAEKGQSESKKPKPTKASGAASGVLSDPLPKGAKKYAIIIGITDYIGEENDIGGIGYKDIDATNMKEALVNLYKYKEKNIRFFQDETAIYSDIITAVNEIGGLAKAGDEVVFYFSGHGGFINDTEIIDEADGVDEAIIFHDDGILDDDLKELFKDFAASRIVFIFDSCFAGGMNDVAGDNRIVAMATTENTYAYAYVDHANETTQGHFSYYFVERGIIGGFADKYDHDDDGILARGRNTGEGSDVVVEEAFDYAKKKCFWQTPVISDYFPNDLLIGY